MQTSVIRLNSIELIRAHPGIGTPFARQSRRLPLETSHDWVYCVEGDILRVLAIAYQRRRPGYWGGGVEDLPYPTRRISVTPVGRSVSFTVTL